MVINHLLNGMILQVGPYQWPYKQMGFTGVLSPYKKGAKTRFMPTLSSQIDDHFLQILFSSGFY